MNEDFDIKELPSNFDIKSFLFKVLNYWYLFAIALIIGLSIAYFQNARMQNEFSLDSLISVENDQNPFFTSNTSISFNYGGVTDKVQTVITSLRTRNHNEKVVDSLQFYVQYLTQAKYWMDEAYKSAPFKFELDKSKPQILGHPISIKFISDDTFEISTNFESENGTGQVYATKENLPLLLPQGQYIKTFKVGEVIKTTFLNGKIVLRSGNPIQTRKEYFINFLNFDNVVNQYQTGLKVESRPVGSSVLSLSLRGTSKSKIVDYLNATVAILQKSQLERKNLYATNTIKFINDRMDIVGEDLKKVEDELNKFRSENKVFNIDDESGRVSEQLKEFEALESDLSNKIAYLNSLQTYLETKTDYTQIAAPSSVGIEEANIVGSVQRIMDLSIARQKLEYTTRETSEQFKNIDRQIDAEKNVLLETLNQTKKIFSDQLNSLKGRMASLETTLSKLPKDQQDFLKIQRRFNLSEEEFNVFQTKRSEAEVVKAANVSDINVIDEAKDIGGGLVGPNKRLNYLIALFAGIIIPLMLIVIITFFDNSVHSVADIERLSKIPVLGIVGKYRNDGSLAVYNKPKSAIAEAFRAVRSSLKFIYKTQKVKGTKTVMVTSSVSGEGKTFCAINIATVFALTNKKTVLVGLDLRKPKISKDFNLKSDLGVVDYLIDSKNIEDIAQPAHIDNLDIILSGSIPPNPSELLMSDEMDVFIEKLKEKYDIIVLDTPPLGLVTDAIELVDYADATIYLVRQNYTKKDMLTVINDKYKKGEVKNISFVLNYYTHKRGQGYGYGYSYGYGYHDNDNDKNILGKIGSFFKRKS